jgi:hypothetical protein
MNKRIILFLMLCPLWLWAQDNPTLTVSTKKQVMVGERFQVVFEANAEGKNFQAPSFDGLTVLGGPFTSTSSSFSMVNGSMSHTVKCTYTYALQAARQLTYNMWQDGIGYGERTLDEVGMGFADEIKDKKNREGLMLSNNYLTLAKPIVEGPATKRWRLFEETWEKRTQADADDVQTTIDKKSWLGEFGKRCDEFFNSQFRQHGVV